MDRGTARMARLYCPSATRKEIAAEDYNLSASRYVKEEVKEGKWPHKTVEELCSRIFSGGTPSTKNSEYWNGNIPWISSADIIDMYTAIPRRFVTDEAIRQSSTKIYLLQHHCCYSRWFGKTI
jgi:type I restriction-modification system DNA methylase subunit